MITVTLIAARQIQASIAQGDAQGMALRLAARFTADGFIEYAMGFDERSANDALVSVEGVDLLIHESHQALLNGATLDFAEVSPGQPGFVFRNPNAPHSSCGGGGCGGGDCGSGCA
ncbi:MAG TPA: iron-sulfur cluster assembly accessory protein [Sulfuriferula sp.]|nr:iron-sulfur cluster assembly accessory protein [Sulfuriferula sp.]